METCYGSAYLEQVIIKYKEAKTLNECEDKIKNWSWNSWAYTICGSYRPGLFCKKSVLRNFAKYTGKHLCQSLFYFIEKKTLVQALPCEFFEISKKTFAYRAPPGDYFSICLTLGKTVLQVTV